MQVQPGASHVQVVNHDYKQQDLAYGDTFMCRHHRMGLAKCGAVCVCVCVCRRAGRFAVEVVKTTNELESVVTIIVANDKQMPRRDPLRPLMEVQLPPPHRSTFISRLAPSSAVSAPAGAVGAGSGT
jgi:hypothetical protein